MQAELKGQPGVTLEYVAVVDPATFVRLQPDQAAGDASLALVAARVGRARLIDNAWITGVDLAGYLAPAVQIVSADSRLADTGATAWNA